MAEEIVLPFPRRRRSPEITPEMAAMIKAMLNAGIAQHDIAAHFSINQGRVSEINTGNHRYAHVASAQIEMIFT